MPISVKAQFERNKLDKSKAHSGYLMVSLAAKDTSFTRMPASFTLVLDVSGSMADPVTKNQTSFGISNKWNPPGDMFFCTNGLPPFNPFQPVQSTVEWNWLAKRKIDVMKETAIKFVENLSEQDEISIVTFDSNVKVLVPRLKGANKESLKSLINSLQPGTSTNLSGGLLQACQLVNREFEGVRRVIALTDGLPNVGVSDPEGLKAVIAQMTTTAGSKKPYCTVSTFGFGTDCNQELLADMAKTGSGNYYFVADGADLQNTFAKELGGVLGCMAQNIEVKVSPNRGIKVESILNNFTVGDDNGVAVIKAEDIYVSENKHILIKLALKEVSKPKPRPVSIAHVEIAFDDLQTKKRQSISLNPKISYVKTSEADVIPVLEVVEQVAILEAAKAHKEAVKMANVGNFIGAASILRSASFFLDDAAHRGSEIAMCASSMHNDAVDNFTPEKYNASYGSTVSASADSTLRTRVGTKGLSDVYMNDGAAKMTKAFEATPTSSVVPPTPISDDKGFAKERE